MMRRLIVGLTFAIVCAVAAIPARADSPCTTGSTFIGNGANVAQSVTAVNSGNGITSSGGCTPTIAITLGPSGNLVFGSGLLDFSATPTITGLATLAGGFNATAAGTFTGANANLTFTDGNGITVPAVLIGKSAATGTSNSQQIQFRSNNGTTDGTCNLSFQSNLNAIFSCGLISTGVVQSVGLLNSSYVTALRLSNTTAGACGTTASPLTGATTITSFFGCQAKLTAATAQVFTFSPAFSTNPPVCFAQEAAASTTPGVGATPTGTLYGQVTLTTYTVVSTSATDASAYSFNCIGGK